MDSFRQRSDWGALPVVRLLWSILAGRLRRVLTAVRGTDRQSAALQQVAAAYWGVTDLTNGVRGGLWPGGSAMCRLVGAGGGRVLSRAPYTPPQNVKFTQHG